MCKRNGRILTYRDYSGSTYIPSDEKLLVRLEVKLRKPDLAADSSVF